MKRFNPLILITALIVLISCSRDSSVKKENDMMFMNYFIFNAVNASLCPRPYVVCTTVYDPVCGSNKQTYSNACQAQIDCVDIAHTGPCL